MSDSVDARMVEAAARALAIENGGDPDQLEHDMGEDVPLWTLYVPDASAVVAALQPFRDAEQAETREDGASRIAAERQRQMAVEGWTSEHDDSHRDGELADAAATYAMTPQLRAMAHPSPWPWQGDEFKPGDRIRELEKAGALIAAEIDRLERVGVRRDA